MIVGKVRIQHQSQESTFSLTDKRSLKRDHWLLHQTSLLNDADSPGTLREKDSAIRSNIHLPWNIQMGCDSCNLIRKGMGLLLCRSVQLLGIRCTRSESKQQHHDNQQVESWHPLASLPSLPSFWDIVFP